MGQAASAALSVIGMAQGMEAQRRQEREARRAGRQSEALTAEQLGILRENIRPFLSAISPEAIGLVGPIGEDARESMRRARLYDPARETEEATRGYDVASRESLTRDLSGARSGALTRGLKGSSEEGMAVRNVLGRRASDRAAFVTGLRLSEQERRDAVTGRASDRGARAFQLFNPTGPGQAAISGLQGPAQSAAERSAFHYGLASQWDPSGYIDTIQRHGPALVPPWLRRRRRA